MSLDEFGSLIDRMGVYNENFGAKQVATQFSLAMMTQIDELDSNRHMDMSFAEFVEAIARVAQKLEIPSLELDKQYTLKDIREGTISSEDYKIYAGRSLPEKLEALL